MVSESCGDDPEREREPKKNQVEVEVEKKREKLKIFTLSLFFLSLHPFCSPPLPAATAPQCRLPCRRPPCAPCAPPRPRGECLARRDTEEKAAAWEEAAASKSKQREQSSTLALASLSDRGSLSLFVLTLFPILHHPFAFLPSTAPPPRPRPSPLPSARPSPTPARWSPSSVPPRCSR